MAKVTIYTLDSHKAVLIINGKMVKGNVEYYRGKPTVIAENGKVYDVNNLK